MVDNYMTVYENLPHKIAAFIMYHAGDDFYTIVLNSRNGYERNMQAFEHEMKHIINNDFSGYREVGLLETARHI